LCCFSTNVCCCCCCCCCLFRYGLSPKTRMIGRYLSGKSRSSGLWRPEDGDSEFLRNADILPQYGVTIQKTLTSNHAPIRQDYQLLWICSSIFSNFIDPNSGMIPCNRPRSLSSISLPTHHSRSSSHLIWSFVTCRLQVKQRH
jgi:hypothetical protein